MTPKGVIYLEEESVKIEGVRIYGSPVTPYYFGMAFNKTRGQEIKRHWQKIPSHTDILITHGPPKGFLDASYGCADLAECVEKVQPVVHLFGHIHEARGMEQKGKTLFVNAAKF